MLHTGRNLNAWSILRTFQRGQHGLTSALETLVSGPFDVSLATVVAPYARVNTFIAV